MSAVIDQTPAPSPEELAAAGAGIELARLDQAAKAEGQHVDNDQLEALAERFGEVAVDAALHASLDAIHERGAELEAEGAVLRARIAARGGRR